MQNCWGGGWGVGGKVVGGRGLGQPRCTKADVQMANDSSFFPQNVLSVTFETIQNFLGIFYLTSSNSVQQTQTLVSTKTRAVRALKLLVFISYLVLALTSAVTNLPNIS